MKKVWIIAFQRQFLMFPFEVAFALYSVYMGVSGLVGLGSTSGTLFVRAIGNWSVPFNIMYAVAGVAIYLGLVLLRRNVEAFGLVILATSLVIRSLVIAWCNCGDGRVWGQLNVHVLHALFLVACASRLVSLIEKRYIALSEDQVKVKVRI